MLHCINQSLSVGEDPFSFSGEKNIVGASSMCLCRHNAAPQQTWGSQGIITPNPINSQFLFTCLGWQPFKGPWHFSSTGMIKLASPSSALICCSVPMLPGVPWG